MGGIFKAVEKPFRTGASSQKRQAEEQARLQRERMQQEKERFERSQAEQRQRNEELKAQQEASRNQAELQEQLARDAAASAVDDTTEIQIGTDLTSGVGARKRKRPQTGSTALGL